MITCFIFITFSVFEFVLLEIVIVGEKDTKLAQFINVCIIVSLLLLLLCSYALDVNVERAEDVLAHKRLLQFAEDPANQPAFQVRSVQVNTYAFVGIVRILARCNSVGA